MKKKTERQIRDIKLVSILTRVANESVDKIKYTNILRLKTSIEKNGGFLYKGAILIPGEK